MESLDEKSTSAISIPRMVVEMADLIQDKKDLNGIVFASTATAK